MKFRRKSQDAASEESTAPEESLEQGPDADQQEDHAPTATPALDDPTSGPFDADDLPEDDGPRIDLGSLLIGSEPGRELRLQVDDKTGNVQAIVLAGSDGAVEVRAFAAPRHGDLWSDVRPQIAADMVQRGGVATVTEGRFGDELHCELQIARPEGGQVRQISRIVGINGPRWMLRVTFLGRPAAEPDNALDWEKTITQLAVRRGDHAMAVGEPLPVILPENARKVGPAAQNPVADPESSGPGEPGAPSGTSSPQQPEQN